jgi:hypothetical protein
MIQVFSNNSVLLKLAAMSPLNKGGGEIARGTSNGLKHAGKLQADWKSIPILHGVSQRRRIT